MAISKRILVQRIIEQLSEQLATLAQASRAMHADASDEQNKAEDKYDTRGLETAYLASSQARLATEIEQARAVYQNLELRKFGEGATIDVTALVELEANGAHTLYFLGPKAGGMEISHRGSEILVITTESPLGQQLVGKKAGDHVNLQTRGPSQEFQVISVR
ncbi:MAG: GreA/GreB family elongation factor [Verrucomicrobiia bacterium]